MTQEIIFQDKHLLLTYIPDGKYIHETWWGLTPSFKFLKYLDIIINTLEEKQADGLLLDAREHLGLTQKDRDIAAEKHFNYALEHGKLYQAIMVPKDMFSEHSVKSYGQQFENKNNCVTKFFIDIEAAEKWLKNPN